MVQETTYHELFFWIGYIFSNAILYAPTFFFSGNDTKIFPFIANLKKGYLGLTLDQNLDPWRFKIEVLILVCLPRVIPVTNDLIWLFAGVYGLTLIYSYYYSIFRNLFQIHPTFYTDWKLVKNAFAIVRNESVLKVIGYILSACLTTWIGSYLFYLLISRGAQLGVTTGFIGTSLLFFLVFLLALIKRRITRPYPLEIFSRVHSVIFEIATNIRRSMYERNFRTRSIATNFEERRKVPDFKLHTAPDVYFIFIESYGSTFFTHMEIRDQAAGTYDNFCQNLHSKGFQIRTSFSESPTLSGQSWLTYSSFLYGTKMENNNRFETYLRNPTWRQSDHLLNLFHRNGYTNFNLNPIRPINGIEVPYDEMRSFYAIDKWYLDADLQYAGTRYGYGYSPADQYSLGFVLEAMKSVAGPKTLFFLTKNSHSPFDCPEWADDWRSLNHSEKENPISSFLKRPTAEDYVPAIGYQYRLIADLLLPSISPESLVFLVGDHQPPIITDPSEDGCNTPVHIISQNPGVIQSFEQHGFNRQFNFAQTHMTHAGLYTVFLRCFLENYATYDLLPPLDPDGIHI